MCIENKDKEIKVWSDIKMECTLYGYTPRKKELEKVNKRVERKEILHWTLVDWCNFFPVIFPSSPFYKWSEIFSIIRCPWSVGQ